MPENSTPADVARKIASYKKLGKRPRVAILTHGAKPVTVGTSRPDGGVDIEEYPVPTLTNEQIVDTNGAGDSFVGALLAELSQGKSFKEAVNAGIYLSGEVVKRSGCTFPAQINPDKATTTEKQAEPPKKAVGYLNFSDI